MKAVQDEIEAEQATQLGGVLGGAGGALIGAAGGSIPVKIGNALNNLKDKAAASQGLTPVRKPMGSRLKPGPRMAGGLTGLILGGGLGAGVSALMKRDSEAAQILGKIQSQNGVLDEVDEARLSAVLGDVYNSPSQLM